MRKRKRGVPIEAESDVLAKGYSGSEKALRSLDQMMSDDDNVATQAVKKELFQSSTASSRALKNARTMSKKRNRLHHEIGESKKDGVGRKILDGSYVITQGIEAGTPDKQAHEEVGTTSARAGIKLVATAIESVATADKKSKKSKLVVSDEKKLKHEPVASSKSTNKLTHVPKPTSNEKKFKHHKKEALPPGEALKNRDVRSITGNIRRAAFGEAGRKIHQTISESEKDNVGVEATHRLEQKIESRLYGRRRLRNAVRYIRNRPIRRENRLRAKQAKSRGKLEFKRIMKENPTLRKNPIFRIMQKRSIKKSFAAQLRAATQSIQTNNNAVEVIRGGARTVFAIKIAATKAAAAAKVAILLVKAGLFGLLIMVILSLFTMCTTFIAGIMNVVVTLSHHASYESITDASALYRQWEAELIFEIREILDNPDVSVGYTSIGDIRHNPFELMAFLTAVYGDFTLDEVRSTLEYIFSRQYVLTVSERTELRTVTNPATGEEIIIEIRIVDVSLEVTPLREVLESILEEGQLQHFELLVKSQGMRQIVENPFGNTVWWPSFMTSPYGYRINPTNPASGLQFHAGIDIAPPGGIGVPMFSGIDGVVTFAGNMGGYGITVVITSYEKGLRILYAHCDQLFVSVGQTVSVGDLVANMGTTGDSTGPHLHLEVFRLREDGSWLRLNPIFFVHNGSVEL